MDYEYDTKLCTFIQIKKAITTSPTGFDNYQVITMSYLSVNAPYPHNKSDSLSSQQSEYDNVPSSYRHEYKTKRTTTSRNGSNHVNDKHHYEKPQVDHTKKW
ncbi:unnamed protein product, partial [Meganyctiphanes norvegica]